MSNVVNRIRDVNVTFFNGTVACNQTDCESQGVLLWFFLKCPTILCASPVCWKLCEGTSLKERLNHGIIRHLTEPWVLGL